jgi:transposase, IS5 family
MNEFMQLGFFDLTNRYEGISAEGDPLERLNKMMDWKIFLPLINRAFERERKSEAGRKPYDRLLMFKLLVLQSLYNLSDHQVCYMAQDRLSFMRFLNVGLSKKVPDEKTLWSYREVLVQGKVIEKLFKRFEKYLSEQGLKATCGSLVDATLVEVPRQRNSKEENAQIKAGEVPERIQENIHCARQKDLDARWVKKRGENYFGYKNHVNADAVHKLIRSYEVTHAAAADIHSLESLLQKTQTDGNEKKVWADSAYYSEHMEERLAQLGYESRMIRRYSKQYPMGSDIDRENSRRAKIRKRVEHIFGFMENSMGGKMLRTVGLFRAKTKIGLMNLVYNVCRYEQIQRLGVA